MEDVAKLVDAVSSLMWPMLAAGVIYLLREPIAGFVDTWSRRKATIKVNDIELTFEEYEEQARSATGDLQDEVLSLRNAVDRISGAQRARSSDKRPSRILWVDDHPENHALIVSYLRERGVAVSTALTTFEALQIVQASDIDVVVTDMHRVEDGVGVGDAGMRLIQALRSAGDDVPIALYFGRSKVSAAKFRDRAIAAGASLSTASRTELLSFLGID